MARILIIDDDEQVLLTLSEVVETLGHRVATAPDGRRGLELFDRGEFDLVVTDLAMPEVDGLTVLRRVKKKSPGTGVLVITGNSTVDLLAAAVNMGVDAYITKPFKIAEIDEQMSRILARTGAHRAAGASSEAERTGLARVIGLRVPLGWAIAALAVLLLVVQLVY